MDPVTHTLVGASLAEAGLKRRTALATATLLIGANFPDVDVASMFWGSETMLWFRRGVTHGVPALVLLPFVLTGIMLAWDRWVRRRSTLNPPPAARPVQVLLLATVAVATHPVLDFLNVYGMRWLMPLSGKWAYGDTLFIVDPWVWGVLAAGVFVARRRAQEGKEDAAVRAPRQALLAVAVYAGLMAVSMLAGRRVVRDAFLERGVTVERMMVAPVPVDPFRRWVVVDDGERYRFATLRWLRRSRLEFAEFSYENYPAHPAAAAATRGPGPRKFLSWARFPYYVVEAPPDRYIVRIGDARYTIDPERSWAATSVVVDRAGEGR